MIKLMVGLGNPGKQYAPTRHNAGAWFVQRIGAQHQGTFQSESKFHAEMAQITTAGHSCLLAIPTTFMNDSGRSIQALMAFYKLKPEELLIAHDELDLSPGAIRLKLAGGHGGHNGLRSIIQHIGKDFWRLRIGIGHPGHKDEVASYVLSKANQSEQSHIDQAIEEGTTILDDLFNDDFERAMHTLHSQQT